MDRGRETGNLVFMKDAVQNRSDWAEEGRLWKVYEKEKKNCGIASPFFKDWYV